MNPNIRVKDVTFEVSTNPELSDRQFDHIIDNMRSFFKDKLYDHDCWDEVISITINLEADEPLAKVYEMVERFYNLHIREVKPYNAPDFYGKNIEVTYYGDEVIRGLCVEIDDGYEIGVIQNNKLITIYVEDIEEIKEI